MTSQVPYFLSNSFSCGQALAFAHSQAQELFLKEALLLGHGLDEAEQLLNASIPNHIQKTHVLAIRANSEEGWFVFHKKNQHSADFQPYWFSKVEAKSLGFGALSHHLAWLEIGAELKNKLAQDRPLDLGAQAIALDLLLSPLCTLSRSDGALRIERSFAQISDLQRLRSLSGNSDSNQYLGLDSLAQWLRINESRPASERTHLNPMFSMVEVESAKGQLCPVLETHAVLTCSDTEPCQNNGRLRDEFIDPSPEMLEALESQGLQVSSQRLRLINASEIKKVADHYFSDLLFLLKTLPD